MYESFVKTLENIMINCANVQFYGIIIFIAILLVIGGVFTKWSVTDRMTLLITF